MDTVQESVLRMEMAGLESQEEDTPRCVLFFKPMSWLGQIRSHHRDESSDPSDSGEATCGLRMQKISGRCTG